MWDIVTGSVPETAGEQKLFRFLVCIFYRRQSGVAIDKELETLGLVQ
jgi:hypothetical protein